jgi:phosphoesterase RecJ-like protein
MLGDTFPGRDVTGPVVVLDHHASGRPFGDLYVGDPQAAAVGVLVARVARALGWPVGADAAQGIYVSIVVDSGSFRYSNTNAEVLRLAADLVDAGMVDPWTVSEQLHERAPLSRYRLLAAALQSLELAAGGKLAFITVTAEMVAAAGAAWDDTEGIVGYARGVDGVECGVLLTPARGGGTRVSMRSRARAIDAGKVAFALGGGGHPGAAGCKLPTEDLGEARRIIGEALEAALAAGA